MGNSEISGTCTRLDCQHPHQLFRTQGGNYCPISLGFSAPGPPGFDRYGQYNSSFLYQQTRRDPFPVIVMSSSGSFCVATSSDHSSQSQTHSRLFEHDSKPPIKAQSANNERVESPFRNCDSDIQGLGHPRQWTCSPQSTIPAFLSSCLQFRSH